MLPKEPPTPPICWYSRAHAYAKLLFHTDLQMIMNVLYYITDFMIIVLRHCRWNEQSDGPNQVSGSAECHYRSWTCSDFWLQPLYLRFITASRVSAIAVYEKGNQFEKLHFDCINWLLSLTDILSASAFIFPGKKNLNKRLCFWFEDMIVC